jgi:DNA repair exonuclease SbcCD ATPase subunit
MEVLMYHRVPVALIAAMFALSWAIPATAKRFASQANPPAKKARKVWTNEDLEALRPGGITILKPSPAVSAKPSATSEEAAAKEEEKTGDEKKEGVAPLEKIRKKLEPLRSELAVVEMRLQTLRGSLASGNTTGGAINVDKAPGGLNTDNQITQLENRRSELKRQISDIEDEARRLGIPPGALR